MATGREEPWVADLRRCFALAHCQGTWQTPEGRSFLARYGAEIDGQAVPEC